MNREIYNRGNIGLIEKLTFVMGLRNCLTKRMIDGLAGVRNISGPID